MKLGAALEALRFAWWEEIDAAKRGDFKLLIKTLRSDRPIPAREERQLRDAIASALAGEFKRTRGKPAQEPMPAWRRVKRRDPDLFCAVFGVARYKDVQARRYNRRQGVEAEAIAWAARKYNVPEQKIFNYLHHWRRWDRR
jgi:hypothetical protein